jgi:serine/threonine-protein kinase
MPKVGDVVAGKYRLEKVAGEGGMGIVYAAEHLVLKQRVAVKVLLPSAAQSDAVVERFAREAQAAAKITSEHVARVMDAGSLKSGAPFLVMEFLEGCDLEELLELSKEPLQVEEAVDYIIQALEGLAHAHAAGIVHRDLKPANLFLACRPDGGNTIKLLDFGISKSVKARPEDKRLTGQHVLGSPIYMSPEQLRNAKDIDGRADLWSIGVVAYELLTNEVPFDGEGVGEIFAAVLEKEVEPVHHKNWRVSEELSRIIEKALSRNVEDRWQDAAILAKKLAPFGTGAFTPIVERAEQVLARAKQLAVPDTPAETRAVVDAIVAAAERARTTASRSMPPPSEPKVPVLELATETLAEPPPADVASAPGTVTERDGITTRARRIPRSRWIGMAAAAAVVLFGLGAGYSAVRRMRAAEASAPVSVNAVVTIVPAASGSAGDEDDENVPMVMDLPDNQGQGQNGAGTPRTRAVGSGKPQRPKFLKTRE